MILDLLIAFSGFSFLLYGTGCLFSKHMVVEFDRFGLGQFRVFTGGLQLLGAIALFIGLKIEWLAYAGSAGLMLLMFLGFLVRLKIRDGLVKSSPAFIYMILNMVILIMLFRKAV